MSHIRPIWSILDRMTNGEPCNDQSKKPRSSIEPINNVISHFLRGLSQYAWVEFTEITPTHLQCCYQKYRSIIVVFRQLSLKTWIKNG